MTAIKLPALNLDLLGVPAASPLACTLLYERLTHIVYRVAAAERRFILKAFSAAETTKEKRYPFVAI